MLFLEFHNVNRSALETQYEMLESLLRERGAVGIARGIGPDERVRLWEARHRALDSIKRNHPGKAFLQVDACVPISRFPELVDSAKEAVRKEGATGFIVGHAGDGNLHVALLVDGSNPNSLASAERVNVTVVECALAMRGTCAGEHGVGLAKLPFMIAEHGLALKYMRRVKEAFDPAGILNPGKVLPE
jgi:D-lactate dehydrogenase (cytochrome)